MPQMKPLMWMLLMLVILILYYYLLCLIYWIQNFKKLNNMKFKLKLISFKWLW